MELHQRPATKHDTHTQKLPTIVCENGEYPINLHNFSQPKIQLVNVILSHKVQIMADFLVFFPHSSAFILLVLKLGNGRMIHNYFHNHPIPNSLIPYV